MMHDSDWPPRGSSSDFVGALDDAIRQNPIPAALVGVGILWLFAGGRNVMLGGASRTLANGIARGAQDAGNVAYRGARAATGIVADGMHAAAESATGIGADAAGAIRSATDKMGSVVNHTGEIIGEAASQAAGGKPLQRDCILLLTLDQRRQVRRFRSDCRQDRA